MMLLDLTPELLIKLALVIPIIGAGAIALFGRFPNLREAATLTTAAALVLVVASLTPHVMSGARPEAVDFTIVRGLTIAFKVEPLGMLFALVASTLWLVNSIYSIGYMRANNEPRQTVFYICFAVAIASAIGIAFSRNLFTLFLFYETLTLSTYPLVTHKGDDNARRGGRIYLLLLLTTSMVLLLPAIIGTYAIAGTLDFTPGGILAGKIYGPVVIGLLALYVFGIGKAAVMPVHFWLPNAMVAPTPVSAFLHAVAVVKAGVFSILKIVVYIFGPDFLLGSGAADPFIYIAGGTVILASLMAMTKDNLKARLAYSTISQLSYIVLGALIATKWALMGSGLHIAMHAAGKITLFFCAGAIYTAARKTKVSELSGLGRVMPFTFAAFTIGALSIIGLPPLGGLWSKWLLAQGALDANHYAIVAIFMISSLLNIAYLLPIPIKAFFGKLPDAAIASGGSGGTSSSASLGAAAVRDNTAATPAAVKIKEAPLACLIAIGITSLACILLFFFPQPLYELLAQAPFEFGNDP